MTKADKFEFLERTKESMVREYGIAWVLMEAKILEDIENTFDDKRFVKMDPDFQIDAAYARKAFGNKKTDLVDYLLWSLTFVTHSDYVEW